MIPCEFKAQSSSTPRRGWLISVVTTNARLLVAYDDDAPANRGWSKGSLALEWVEARYVRILRTQISLFDDKPATARASVALPDAAETLPPR